MDPQKGVPGSSRYVYFAASWYRYFSLGGEFWHEYFAHKRKEDPSIGYAGIEKLHMEIIVISVIYCSVGSSARTSDAVDGSEIRITS